MFEGEFTAKDLDWLEHDAPQISVQGLDAMHRQSILLADMEAWLKQEEAIVRSAHGAPMYPAKEPFWCTIVERFGLFNLNEPSPRTVANTVSMDVDKEVQSQNKPREVWRLPSMVGVLTPTPSGVTKEVLGRGRYARTDRNPSNQGTTDSGLDTDSDIVRNESPDTELARAVQASYNDNADQTQDLTRGGMGSSGVARQVKKAYKPVTLGSGLRDQSMMDETPNVSVEPFVNTTFFGNDPPTSLQVLSDPASIFPETPCTVQSLSCRRAFLGCQKKNRARSIQT